MSALPLAAAFVRRDWRIDLSYRAAFGVQFVSMVFALALFFYLGRIVDDTELSGSQDLSGGYFGYAVMGLALLQIVQAGLSSFSSRLREEQTTGTLEIVMATPASPSMIILSMAAYEFLRGTARGLGMLLIAILVFGLGIETDPIGLATAFLALVGCVLLFAAIGVSVAALTMVFKRTDAMLGFVITGLAFLGGVYFPIELLPQPLETVAEILPFTWGVDVVRQSLLGGDVETIKLVGLIASAIPLFPASLLAFRAGLVRAKRNGSLAQY